MDRRKAEPLPRDEEVRQDLYFLALYRLLEAATLAFIFFGPEGAFGIGRHPDFGQAVTVFYLPASLVLLWWARNGAALRWQALVGTGIDIAVMTIAAHAQPGALPAIAMMLLFNVGAAALLLPLRYAVAVAIVASAALVGEYIWSALFDPGQPRLLGERLLFAISYLAFAVLSYLLGRRMRQTRALAVRRGVEVADMAALNELIIRRMRTGVLLVDGKRKVRMANEAALVLLGRGPGYGLEQPRHEPAFGDEDVGERDLSRYSPALAARFDAWRANPNAEQLPLLVGEDAEAFEILPRFVQLMATSQTSLVFLDDASQVSRRAESLTLAAMGRFSASLAHEIRNPLAAINYAVQLLEESREMGDADRRLLEIIHQQCQRTNGIVESVLSLARRERAQPEQVDLPDFVRQFVADYKQMLPEENGSLAATAPKEALAGMIDPRHLQQVLTVLVNNALHHGTMPGERARISVNVYELDEHPVVDVLDRGPGIPDGVRAQLFRPFYTTSPSGTGLGLYIARELCHANGARLEYVGAAGGGGCFRITLSSPQSLLDEA